MTSRLAINRLRDLLLVQKSAITANIVGTIPIVDLTAFSDGCARRVVIKERNGRISISMQVHLSDNLSDDAWRDNGAVPIQYIVELAALLIKFAKVQVMK